ncbi:TlpA family protein disulfide reductase [Campylobacter sp.]|uniref:TlpA family protein disulfide reductase n=1 Tax=Campylobacter sp. TaxID=205 RepID=UPI002975BC7A|nr:TlpA family protein disulfide reductase [Campylobacter sp.]MDD6161443.1 TlpA family protein disulfide reductase [Campylobacteraceae bacterium]MCI6339451.1 TlpA family protein disulfide reductase [Campylobacter sp.]MCI6661033.1 TlpA family protein disulfide reductase [Campylobacter sp.]MCI6695462.1 TlpA family protein disulfide reductase [Campylobacter sp.]MCI6819704.1 TlpA family protein disulfide reductase [Campylobacter sp.]
MKKLLLVLLCAFALVFLGCSKNESESYSLGEYAPFKDGEEISLKSVSGASVSLVRTDKGFVLKGSDKIVMLDIFGTFCEPCKAEAPHLMDYQLNHDDFMLIGLITFEQISDKDVIEKFIKPFNAYYFIANEGEKNERLISQVLADIDYDSALSLPFKVVLKGGKYELLSDNLGERGGKEALYYLGAVSSELVAKDLEKIRKK